jgi:hypothetical protein
MAGSLVHDFRDCGGSEVLRFRLSFENMTGLCYDCYSTSFLAYCNCLNPYAEWEHRSSSLQTENSHVSCFGSRRPSKYFMSFEHL